MVALEGHASRQPPPDPKAIDRALDEPK